MRKLALRNLLRNKLRTLLTVISLVLALVLLCFLTAFLDLLENTSAAADNRIVVRSAISLATPLPEAYWRRLETLPHVTGITPLNWYQGTFKDDRPENFFPRFSADPATVFEVFSELEIPAEQLAAWQQDRAGFVAGKALADKYGWKLGDQIFIKGDIYPVDVNLTLRGVFTVPAVPSSERQVFFHRRYLEEAMSNPGIVGTYFLAIDSPDNVAAVTKAAEAMFVNSDAQVRAETEKAFQLSFLEMMGNVRLLFTAIGLAVIVSILFIVANTMAMAARERTTEVAVLKTLGFSQGQVLSLVLLEALVVGLAGALIACGASALLIGVFSAGLEKVMPLFGTLAMTPRAWAIGLGLGLLVGLFSGLAPAVSAARLNIVDALRRVA
ncbi:MAG TPA: FtsX-like permease family protein [Thermoanaerobaculia bacterium]|nr:FtsX-like permease family protein [Thermoanaerobaculia bacterium]